MSASPASPQAAAHRGFGDALPRGVVEESVGGDEQPTTLTERMIEGSGARATASQPSPVLTGRQFGEGSILKTPGSRVTNTRTEDLSGRDDAADGRRLASSRIVRENLIERSHDRDDLLGTGPRHRAGQRPEGQLGGVAAAAHASGAIGDDDAHLGTVLNHAVLGVLSWRRVADDPLDHERVNVGATSHLPRAGARLG